MTEIVKELENERQKIINEAQKYPAGDKRNMYYIGCALGLGKAIARITKEGTSV